MALSREQAEAALRTRVSVRPGRKAIFTPEERKRRQRAQTAAFRDAAAAVSRLHPDEHQELYQVALERRLKAAGF